MQSKTYHAECLTRVFIGSSSSSLQLAHRLKQSILVLSSEASITVWDEAFRPGQLLLAQIVQLVQNYDFGVFVFAADDVLLLQGNSPTQGSESRHELTVRDNVLFEAGVFMGGLGHERTFLIVPRGVGLRTPSDLEGLLTRNYRVSSESDDADIEDAAKQIAVRILELGSAPRSTYDEMLALRQTLNQCEFKDKKKHLCVLGEMVSVAAHTRERSWHTGVDPNDVMTPILEKWSDSATDNAYWWLVVHGIFRFVSIEQFTSDFGWHWTDSIEFVELSPRGAALMNLLQRSSKPE